MSRQFLFSVTKDDLKIETLARGGPGGQNQNKISSFVRIRHPESGAVGEPKEERTQWQNKKIALRRLAEHPKFKLWLNKKYYELKTGKTIDQIVDEMIDLKNIKMEIRDEKGRWVIYEEKEDATTLLS